MHVGENITIKVHQRN